MSSNKINSLGKVGFRFFGNLCDFLPKRSQGHFLFSLIQPTSVKDAIEAIGIPHVEIGYIYFEQKEVSFSYLLQASDNIDVYPTPSPITNTVSLLRAPLIPPYRFILDVHLGSLARLLRLSGFDTYYKTEAADADIAKIAANEKRIVLTRDIGLLKHKIIDWGYWIRSQYKEEQFKEVAYRFNLWPLFSPFSFCLACNGKIQAVSKEHIHDRIPSNAAHYFQAFYQCQSCLRVYWKGSHYDQMLKTLDRIQIQH
jgi:uncharacterized protein with PIN domain